MLAESKPQRWTPWTDPRWGAVVWPLTTAYAAYQDITWLIIFSAFLAGVSIQRWLGEPKSTSP